MCLAKICSSDYGEHRCIIFLKPSFKESDRPELLTRTFDHKYLVKYLVHNFTVYDGVKTTK